MFSPKACWAPCLAILAVVSLAPPAALSVGPEDAQEWAVGSAISVTITSPANNTYLPINRTQSLTATASDLDCYRVGTTWYTYSDDVTSGGGPTDYHVWWTKTGDGELTDEYGTSGSYLAPGYAYCQPVRNVMISADADDFSPGGDTYGYNDFGNHSSITLKVWEVTLYVDQSGTASENYDGEPVTAFYGGDTLGWIVPGTPANAECYDGNTQVKGTIPQGPGVTEYQWYQYKKGLRRHKVNGREWYPHYNQPNWEIDFGPTYEFGDADSRHPDLIGPDMREILARDQPGFIAGATNDWYIDEPDNWTDYNFDMDFKTWVELNNIIISNEPEWEVIFTLDVQNGNWHVVGGHTPE